MTDLTGRAYLVTGATSGIGRATAEELARRGGTVVLACRSEERAKATIGALRRATGSTSIFFVPLDLADLASVRAAARSFCGLGLPLHVLVNNAGIGGVRGVTRDGFELAFGTNHLGHFLLTNLLLDQLRAAAPARVVTVASDSHYHARGIDFDALRRPTRFTARAEYAMSKLCNVLFTQELARREGPNGVSAFAVHPGVVATGIWKRVPWPARSILMRTMLSATEGARTSLYCATEPGLEAYNGGYFHDCTACAPSPVATPELAAALWRFSEECVRT